MHERAFVLVPLLELDPDPVLPGHGRISERRLAPNSVLGVRPFASPLVVPS
jgi:7,8-dihydro-6-hydroxymethylpterin-pyrophosphokinase